MVRSRTGSADYTIQVRQALRRYLPARGLPLLTAARRWSDRLLVMTILLMVFSSLGTLQDRFTEARAAVVSMYGSRKRPGKSYTGFMGVLQVHSARLLELVVGVLRRRMIAAAGSSWKVRRHLAFGVDGTKSDAPRTKANRRKLKIGGKKKSGPQQLLVALVHLGTGLPWSWRRGEATASERELLLKQLAVLPPGALLVADAGFAGYRWIRQVLASGQHVLVRAGANVRLLRKLGWEITEKADTVYVWPAAMREAGGEPLTLRRIVLLDGRNRRMCLLSDLTHEQLSLAEAQDLYRRRWGLEVFFRGLKQTLARRKMLAHAPVQAGVELDWTMAGYWLLGLWLWENRPAAVPSTQGLAWALKLLRNAIVGRGDRRRSLSGCFRRLKADRYVRLRPKKAWRWAHKKHEKPCGMPKVRMAKEHEIRSAKGLRRLKQAA